MPRKRGVYTKENISKIAEETANKEKAQNTKGVPFQLTCYLPEGLGASLFNIDGTFKRQADIPLEWKFEYHNRVEKSQVSVRCNNAVDRATIPLPIGWAHALRSVGLNDLAAASAQRVCTREKLTKVTCELLGQPVLPQTVASELFPGKAVPLNDNGTRMVYLLVAHVLANDWLCHMGTRLLDDSLDELQPFRENELALRNVSTELCSNAGTRLRTTPSTKQIRVLAQSGDEAWWAILAIGHFRACEMRAQKLNQPFDRGEASRMFQANAFHWSSEEHRNSQVKIFFLWEWSKTAGEQARAFVSPTLNNVLKVDRHVPAPTQLCEKETELHRKLDEIADRETKNRKAPCKYLGLEVSAGHWEKNPANWPDYQQGKTHALVWYEWEFVKLGSSPHRVLCNVHHMVHDGRHVPQNPLGRSCPKRLTFSMEFMQAVANNVQKDIEFKGIAFETCDRATIRSVLPNSGIDLQDEPCYWILPRDGRCVSWSVCELASKRLDELLVNNSQQAYHVLGEEVDHLPLGSYLDEKLTRERSAIA